MNRRIGRWTTVGNPLRLIIAIILLVSPGRAFDANAQTETILHNFGSFPTDGDEPAGLVQGSDGNFYGVTEYGGTNGDGNVFRISPSGTYTTLYQFGSSPTDGDDPYRGLVQGNDGNFYGATVGGGTNGGGTIFRISPSGTYTTLYQFGSSPTDGNFPTAVLVQGSDGNFYGTTDYGGTNDIADGGDGTVFRISPNGNETILYSFGSSPTDGENPFSGLVQGSDGYFYGTTEYGGTNDIADGGDGTVFRISPSGNETILHQFGSSPTDGSGPRAELVQGSDGNFYGTTEDGGTNDIDYGGDGTVFRISPSGSYTTLYQFGSYPTDGQNPETHLVQGSDGNFYGTTVDGGTNDNGIVFRISPSGGYTILYFFGGYPNDGSGPFGPVQGNDGNFYGTTTDGGTNACECGTVFKLTVPLNPSPYPINQITSVHIATTNIIFAIPSIAGETYQLQFSSSMKPTNWVNVSGVSVTNSIGALLTLTNFGGASQPQGFYRFDITP